MSAKPKPIKQFTLPVCTPAHSKLTPHYKRLHKKLTALKDSGEAAPALQIADSLLDTLLTEYKQFKAARELADNEVNVRYQEIFKRAEILGLSAKHIKTENNQFQFIAVNRTVSDDASLKKLHPDAFAVVPAEVKMQAD